ncbi:SDR family oxidoreductase [Variovorax sp. PDNC026]|uniref:SDR family NAD(P)-dependent oxidoreductase n=1 Tax=Variovorax sp. PDNC026 TaxID=2811425 RepID=UPI001963DD2B|nr:SDR family NAD(P)-dependent oxidoreductase [Variovorax sp. PDNC026]QRY31852.1 SDR family oxidoreductase [Variovorax sp. PDNC026]
MTAATLELEGRVALVTGAARGLGFATAKLFASQGATVILNDLDEDVARASAAELGTRHTGVGADVSNEAAVQAMVDRVAAQHGRIDILVNNAGIFEKFIPTVDQSLAYWQRLIDVHLTGTFLVSRTAARHMIARGRGVILNTSSVGGVLGLPIRTAYSSAKAGIGMMTRVLACEWAPMGLRVNAVAPGYIDSRSPDSPSAKGHLDVERVKRRIPMGRLGRPEDVAQAMLFLASERARFITGVTLPVDGGYMAFGAPSDAYPLVELPEELP